jgi:hypothetical protein
MSIGGTPSLLMRVHCSHREASLFHTSQRRLYRDAEAGNKQAALKNLRRLRELASKGYVSPVAAALIHFGLRETDRGFAELDRAYEAHDPYLLYLKVDPAFDAVRLDGRFQDLMRRVGI